MHVHRHEFCRLVSRWRNETTGEWACVSASPRNLTYWADLRREDSDGVWTVLGSIQPLVGYLRRHGFTRTAERPPFCCP